LQNGQVRRNSFSVPLTLTPTTKAIGTFFFRSHAVVAFRNFCYGCLQSEDILKGYGLNLSFPWVRVWCIMSVDASSGRAVLLAQGVVVPRIIAFSDCAGNYQSLGRFLVFNSRMILYLSLYIVSECFESFNLPLCWSNIQQVILKQSLPAMYQDVTGAATVKLASLRQFLFEPNEGGADFFVTQVPNVRRLMRAGHQIYRTAHSGTQERASLDMMLISVIPALLQMPPATGSPPARKKAKVDSPEHNVLSVLQLGEQFHQFDPLAQYQMQILRTISYYMRGQTATIGFLVLDCSQDEEAVSRHMQALVLSIFLHLAWCDDAAKYELYSVRHKSVVRGGSVLRTGCWEDRTAWNFLRVGEKTAYGYLAGGTPHQPAHTYALVFKRMSFPMADRLYALGLFITGSDFQRDCLIIHPQTCKIRGKEELRIIRSDSISSLLNLMKRKSSTFSSQFVTPAPDALAASSAHDLSAMD